MKYLYSFLFYSVLFLSANLSFSQGILIDHHCSKLNPIPATAIENAKQTLHIAYGHTSHGSQLTDGMTGLTGQTNLVGYKGDIYEWNEGGTDGASDIDDYFGSGDLGHNGDTTWAPPTRTYLANNPEVNVIMYSWCGGCSDNTYAGIQSYLHKMNELEQDYPNVMFVYMTGHTDIWNDATLKQNNQQIRDYCIANHKILYDFADIESYDPDGTYYEFVNDNCNFYDDASGSNLSGNWATEWQTSHTIDVDWYSCSAAHSQALNGNLKAYAAWWLFCRLAGWEGIVNDEDSVLEGEIDIYPNPVTDYIVLRLNSDNRTIKNLKIIDLWGRTVRNYSHLSLNIEYNQHRFYLGNLQEGNYIIKLSTNEDVITEKIIVIR